MGDVDVFVAMWGLDSSSREFLEGLVPEVQAEIIATFQPKSHTQSVDRLLRGFAKSVQHRLSTARPPALHHVAPLHLTQLDRDLINPDESETPSLDDIDNFIARWAEWNLDIASVSAALQGHSPQVQRRALAEFSPKPGTRNVNSLFGSFIRSMSTGRGPGKGAPGGSSRSPTPGKGMGMMPPLDGPLPAEPEGVDREIARFAETWKLDNECVAALARQDRTVIHRVLSSFSPKGAIRSIKSLFMGFLRSIASSPSPQSRPGPPGPSGAEAIASTRPPVLVVWPVQPGAAPTPKRGVKRPAWVALGGSTEMAGGTMDMVGDIPTDRELEEFVTAFRLDDESLRKLAASEPSVQREVLRSFCPKGSTQNVNNLFMSFLRSRTGPPRGVFGGNMTLAVN